MKGITYHIIKHIKTKIPGRGNPTKHEAKQLVLITGETLVLKQECSEDFFFLADLSNYKSFSLWYIRIGKMCLSKKFYEVFVNTY